MRKRFVVVGLAVGWLGGAAWAQDAASVYCGSIRCVTLKAAAHGQTPEQRADAAMGVLNKHLGSRTGRFTTAPKGGEVELLLNGDPLMLVTSADAKAEKVRSAGQLAASWRAAFTKAFDATRAQK